MSVTCYKETMALSGLFLNKCPMEKNISLRETESNNSSFLFSNIIYSYKAYKKNDNDNEYKNNSSMIIPKTELVKKLLLLRKSYIENGGVLLSIDEINEEVKNRRGGLYNAKENIS